MSSEKQKNKFGNQAISPGTTYEVTAHGSLGLLALGAAGIKAWRKKREEEKLKANIKENE